MWIKQSKEVITLKKIFAAFLIIVSAFSFAIAYQQTDEKERQQVKKAEEGITQPFWIPNHSALTNPDEIYPLLQEAAKESGVNIFRKNVQYTADNQQEFAKYVLLTGPTRYWDAFQQKSGRWLTPEDTQQAVGFLSSVPTGDAAQVGVIKDFSGNDRITIKPLKTASDYLAINGQYYAEAPNSQTFDAFIQLLVNKLNRHSPQGLTAQQLLEPSEGGGGAMGASMGDYLEYLRYMVFVITMILLIYYIFYESKRIGIMKMHGLSGIHIWYILTGKLLVTLFLLSTAASLLGAWLIPDTTTQFTLSTLLSQVKTYLILTASSLLSYAYIAHIKISNAIKNQKNTKGIFALNTLLKAGSSILLILLAIGIWDQYAEIQARQERLKNWAHAKDYGSFTFTIGNDGENMLISDNTAEVAMSTTLYPILDQMGSIFIDAHTYEHHPFAMNFSNSRQSITVNTNYLKEYPVYDIHNSPVQIPEETSDWILLVPEKYRNQEKAILNYYQEERKGTGGNGGAYGLEEAFFKQNVPDRVKNQQIQIIWLANDQKVFSFNSNVARDDNNRITDPIIQVITKDNSLAIDKSSIFGGQNLKVKLNNQDPLLTYKTLEPTLKTLKLDDNLTHLITINQYLMQEIYELQNFMNIFLYVCLGLITGVLLLTVQNLVIFFSKYQRKFIVRRLFGVGFFRTYREYMQYFFATWVVQLTICLLLIETGGIPIFPGVLSGTKVMIAAAALIGIELIASIISLLIIEGKNKVKVLKGGN